MVPPSECLRVDNYNDIKGLEGWGQRRPLWYRPRFRQSIAVLASDRSSFLIFINYYSTEYLQADIPPFVCFIER